MLLRRDIGQTEFFVYLGIWSGSVLYSIYCFTTSSNKYFQNYHDLYSDFQPGWSIIPRKKDEVDEEWRFMKYLIKKQSVWIIISTTISEIIRLLKLFNILPWWQILISITCILFELGVGALGILLLQPLIFSFTRKKVAIWVANATTLTLLLLYKKYASEEEFKSMFGLDNDTSYFVFIGIYWMNLRCVSCSLDFADQQRSLIQCLSYCLYLPPLISGPFVSFEDFERCHQFSGNLKQRLLKLVSNVFRFMFWLFFVEFCLHFVYVNAIAYHPQWISSFDSWSLYGYGYTMGQFFHIKYLVTYGLANTFSEFEDVRVPTLPICIGRVHLYSDMWKYFDAGLYKFLLRYIYIPLRKTYIKNRLLSSLVCFAFIYVWHGTDYFILIWSVLNYISIITEQFAQWINNKYLRDCKLVKKIGDKWFRRITCVLACPLLALSVISNFFFFAGTEIGFIFAARVLNDTVKVTIVLWTILYTFCQVSTEFRSETNQFNKRQKIEKM